MYEFLEEYNLPDHVPLDLKQLILEYSDHVRIGPQSLSYVLYF